MSKKALIFGINGQDGSYLAEILLQKGYEVHGMIRRTAKSNTANITHILDKIKLHYGDLDDPISLFSIIKNVDPEEIYNEADQDHAGISFQIPSYNFNVTGSSVGKILEIIRVLNKKIKLFQPVTSNMFGKVTESPQNENTKFNPQNPYACAKVFSYYLCKMYRDVYGIYVSVGIFFNHESERRSEDYVTRKITKSVARIKANKQKKLILGDTSAKIDWGHAKEYMQAAWSIMQLKKPDDFVIGTGEAHSVQEFVDEAFKYVNLDPNKYVETNQKLFRPGKNDVLVADISKAKKIFNFSPKVKFRELVKIMMENDLNLEGINNI